MYQAITTRYFGPTNTRGARIKATSGSGLSVYVHCDGSDDSEHKNAAETLAAKLKWDGVWCGGAVAGRDSYAWVLLPGDLADEKTGGGAYVVAKVPRFPTR